MPYGAILEAEYEDGFVLTEDERDVSPYDEERNIFHAILTGAPEEDHGQMVRWSVIFGEKTFSVDWKELWSVDNPRPIYYRNMERSRSSDGSYDSGPMCLAHFFGYQYNNPDGSNFQKKQELT